MARERAFDDEDAELLRAVAHQTAVGLKKAELIERLTAENIVKDMFEALAAGSVDAAEAKAAEARCDLSRPHVFLHAVRAPSSGEDRAAWPELAAQFEAACAVSIRAPSSTPATTGCARSRRCPRRARRGRARCARAARSWRATPGLIVGLSDVDRGAASARRRMREAADAARIGALARGRRRRGVIRGARRVQVPGPPGARRRAARPLPQSVEELIEYDRRRGARSWRRSSASWPIAAASRRAPGRSTSTRTRCVSGSSGSSA